MILAVNFCEVLGPVVRENLGFSTCDEEGDVADYEGLGCVDDGDFATWEFVHLP